MRRTSDLEQLAERFPQRWAPGPGARRGATIPCSRGRAAPARWPRAARTGDSRSCAACGPNRSRTRARIARAPQPSHRRAARAEKSDRDHDIAREHAARGRLTVSTRDPLREVPGCTGDNLRPLLTSWNSRHYLPSMSYDREDALDYHARGRPGKDRRRTHQTARQSARPLAGLLAGRRRAVSRDSEAIPRTRTSTRRREISSRSSPTAPPFSGSATSARSPRSR